MNKLEIVLIMVILAIGGVGAYFLMRPQSDFQVENLSLSQNEIATGETVTAQVDVSNIGDAEGTHTIGLEVGDETFTRDVTLDAGESRTVSFDIEKQEIGTYNINIEDLSETLEVVEPASFELSDLQISPKDAEPGETVTVSVDVQNTGEIEGTHTIKLEVNGNVENTRTVTLEKEESTSVSFNIQRSTSNTYPVRVEELSGSFKVLEPAEFEVSNLSVSSSKLGPNEPVDVSVDVSNVGEKSGKYTVELKINGIIENTKTVTLDGGKSTTVTFTVKRETKKSCSVEIGNLSDSFEVVAPAEFEVSNLSVSPSQVEPREPVTASIDVTNTGDLSEDYTIELKIDGAIENTKTLTLNGGDTSTVSFTVTKTTEQTYSIDIGGLTGSFEVAKAYTLPSSSELAGNITEDTLLTTSKSPYTVTETIQVLEDVTLKIEPGVVIKFNKDTGLNVGGELIAKGTEDKKITFTSNQDNPSPSDWTGIRFVNGAKDAEFDINGNYTSGSVVAFSILEYGGKAPEGSYYGGVLNCKRANPFISNNLIVKNFSQSYGGGIFIRDGEGIKILNNEIKNNESGDQGGGFWIISSDIVIESNQIQGNSASRGGGLYVAFSAGVIEGNNIISNSASSKGGGIFFRDVGTGYPKQKINRNNFKNNTDYAIYRDPSYPGSADIDAAHNYWGTTDKSKIKNKIYDYYDDISLGKVTFEPIATEPF